MSVVSSIRRELRSVATAKRAKANAWFFKTGKGEYGEGDRFLGVTVPNIRAVVKRHRADATLADIEVLLASPLHEERLCALLLLVARFERGDAAMRAEAFDFYVRHATRANNWDLVDLSAGNIVGTYLRDAGKGIALLKRLARSKNLWERRIAMIATFAFTYAGSDAECYEIADLLLSDTHDLMHKAVGWMLREAGKRVSTVRLEAFLLPRYRTMPRTMLRYAIERFPQARRKRYLAGLV